MPSPDPRGAPCHWVRDGSQPTLHPLPSVGSESDTLAKKRGGLAGPPEGVRASGLLLENSWGAGDPE